MRPGPARSAQTTRCGQVLDVETIADEQTGMAEHELLMAERSPALATKSAADTPRSQPRR
jgi:hypothetical protein